MTQTTAYALRLGPNADLKQKLQQLAIANQWAAAAISTCVGSLKAAGIRFANAKDTTTLTGPFEICSLVGTLCAEGVHLHITLADQNGATIGGHVMDGCIIYTTAEIVINILTDLKFSRVLDPRTTFKELKVDPAEK